MYGLHILLVLPVLWIRVAAQTAQEVLSLRNLNSKGLTINQPYSFSFMMGFLLKSSPSWRLVFSASCSSHGQFHSPPNLWFMVTLLNSFLLEESSPSPDYWVPKAHTFFFHRNKSKAKQNKHLAKHVTSLSPWIQGFSNLSYIRSVTAFFQTQWFPWSGSPGTQRPLWDCDLTKPFIDWLWSVSFYCDWILKMMQSFICKVWGFPIWTKKENMLAEIRGGWPHTSDSRSLLWASGSLWKQACP